MPPELPEAFKLYKYPVYTEYSPPKAQIYFRFALWPADFEIHVFRKWLRSFWGHSVHFRFLYTLNTHLQGPNLLSFRSMTSRFRDTGFSKVVKVILGSFGAFPILEKPVSRKRLVIERNGVKFGHRRWVFSVYRILVKLNASFNSGGHSVYLRFSETLCLENGRSHSERYI